MDGVTERKLAALILAEAASLKRQAEVEGVRAYLNPKVRYRPNSRFLLATVRGVDQANRAADLNEMWRRRLDELTEPAVESRHGSSKAGGGSSTAEANCMRDEDYGNKKREREETEEAVLDREEILRDGCEETAAEGADDVEMEKFLQTRVKRGRGAIGARMDSAGPYLSPSIDTWLVERVKEQWEERAGLSNARPSIGPSLPTKREPVKEGGRWERGVALEEERKREGSLCGGEVARDEEGKKSGHKGLKRKGEGGQGRRERKKSSTKNKQSKRKREGGSSDEDSHRERERREEKRRRKEKKEKRERRKRQSEKCEGERKGSEEKERERKKRRSGGEREGST